VGLKNARGFFGLSVGVEPSRYAEKRRVVSQDGIEPSFLVTIFLRWLTLSPHPTTAYLLCCSKETPDILHQPSKATIKLTNGGDRLQGSVTQHYHILLLAHLGSRRQEGMLRNLSSICRGQPGFLVSGSRTNHTVRGWWKARGTKRRCCSLVDKGSVIGLGFPGFRLFALVRSSEYRVPSLESRMRINEVLSWFWTNNYRSRTLSSDLLLLTVQVRQS
jgi:hypothetical protein